MFQAVGKYPRRLPELIPRGSSVSDSALLDLTVTFSGVFAAQVLANVVQDRRERKAQRERAERLRKQTSHDLLLALSAVKRARELLVGDKKAPELRVFPGTLASHRFEVVDICFDDPDRVAQFMMAHQLIELLNKRLDYVAELDAKEIAAPSHTHEHAMQRADAIKKTHELQTRLEALLAFVDPEAAQDWADRFRRE